MIKEKKAKNTYLDKSQPIPVKTQIMYSLSEFGTNPVVTLTAMYMMIFYTDMIGLNVAIVGMIILASKIFDGVSDILAGMVVDNTNTKNGSARPWIFRSAIPLALSYVLLFTVPDVGTVGKIIYVFFSYNFALSISFTIVCAAVNALPIYITNDTKSRSSTYAVRMIFAGLVQLLVSSFFPALLTFFGGSGVQSSYIKAGILFGIVAFIANMVTYYFTSENVSPEVAPREKVELIPALKSILKNKYWMMTLGVILVVMVHQTLVMTVNTYYAKYILGDENLAGTLVLFHHAGGAVFMLMLPMLLSKGISKKKIAVLGGIFMFVGSLITIFTADPIPLRISLFIRGLGFGVVQSVYYGMLADSAEYGELQSGIKAYGVSTSASSMGTKIGTGVSVALLGFALGIAGYDGTLSVQPEAATNAIYFIFNIFPVVIYVVLLAILHFYNLEEKMPEVRRQLTEREAQLQNEAV